MYKKEIEKCLTGTQLLIVIIDATWNVNACYYEVSYASARSLRMRRSTSSVLGSTTCFALVKIYKADFTKSASTMICKMFPLEVDWNTHDTCVFQLMVYKVDR